MKSPTARHWFGSGLVAVLLLLVIGVAVFAPIHDLVTRAVAGVTPLVGGHPFWGAVAFALLSALSAMLAFFSSAVLVPVAVPVWGRAGTALLLWLGWLLGGATTYAIGRFLGRRVVLRLARPGRIRYYERRISHRLRFPLVLLFQVALPSEIPGYVLGLIRYPALLYFAALGIAELPYAVGSVILGDQFLRGHYVPMAILALAALGALAFAGSRLHIALSRHEPSSRTNGVTAGKRMLVLLLPVVASATLACRPVRCWSDDSDPAAYQGGADSPAQVAPPPSTMQAGPLIKINLPAYQLDLFEGVDLARRYRVAIGDTTYPTPVGTFEITQVDWDPWWVPPQSEWARQDSIMAPGPRNPMGRVRFGFRELYFIHGTPEPRSVGSAASHGCVRLYNSDAVDLAKRVLRYAAPGVPQEEIDSLAARRGRTRTIQLERFVPVEIRYDIAVVEGETLVVYPDVYRRLPSDAVLPAALDALGRAAGDSAVIDTAAVRAVIEEAGGKPFSSAMRNFLRAVVRASP